MIIVATSPGRMVGDREGDDRDQEQRQRNREQAIEDIRHASPKPVSYEAAGAFLRAGRDRSRPQPDFMELEVAAVRMNDRVEAADRGLRADRTVAEPEDHVVNLIVDALLHLLVDVCARGGVDRHARLLQESVEDRDR